MNLRETKHKQNDKNITIDWRCSCLAILTAQPFISYQEKNNRRTRERIKKSVTKIQIFVQLVDCGVGSSIANFQ